MENNTIDKLEVYNIIKEIIKNEICHLHVNILKADLKLIHFENDLGIDSLNILLIISEIESTLGISISDDLASDLIRKNLSIESFIIKIVDYYELINQPV